MRRKKTRGNAILEFTFVALIMIPMLLGTTAIGTNLIRALELIQVARDAGSMFARNVDFSSPGGQKIMGELGRSLGLVATEGNITGTTSGSASVILTAVQFVNHDVCQEATEVSCSNEGLWVFRERIVIGNTTLGSSAFGNPSGVTISSKGAISTADAISKAGARIDAARFAGLGFQVYSESVGTGVPPGQYIYIAETAVKGFGWALTPNQILRSYAVF